MRCERLAHFIGCPCHHRGSNRPGLPSFRIRQTHLLGHMAEKSPWCGVHGRMMGINGYCSILLCGRVSSPSLPKLWRKAHSAMHSHTGLRAVHSGKSQGQRVCACEDIQTISLYLGGTTQILSQHMFKTFARNLIPLQGSNANIGEICGRTGGLYSSFDLSRPKKYASMTPESLSRPTAGKVNID